MHSIIQIGHDFLDGLEYQLQFQDLQMLETVEQESTCFLHLAEDCLAVENQENVNRGSRIRTWDSAHANAMYY